MPANNARTSKGERTAQRIMDVAEDLFARRGYNATTLREIAEGAGLREPGLYNHFASKEALYRAVLERTLAPVAQVIDEQLSDVSDTQGLHGLPTRVLELMAEHPPIAALFQRALISSGDSSGDDVAHDLVLDWIESLMKKGLRVLGHLKDGRSRVSDEAALMIVAIFNLNAGYFTAGPLLQRLSGAGASTPRMLSRQKQLVERVVNQLAAEVGSTER